MNEMWGDRTYLIHGCYALEEEGSLGSGCTLRNQPSCIAHYFNWSTTAIKIGQKQIRPENMGEEYANYTAQVQHWLNGHLPL